MTRIELQDVGKDIIKKQRELLSEHRDEWEMGRYSINTAWEEAVKEICLLRGERYGI